MADRDSFPFVELVGAINHRIDLVVTFLAVLEMTRLRLLRIFQSESGEIYLTRRFESREQAYERMQGVDTTLDGPEAANPIEAPDAPATNAGPDDGAPVAET